MLTGGPAGDAMGLGGFRSLAAVVVAEGRMQSYHAVSASRRHSRARYSSRPAGGRMKLPPLLGCYMHFIVGCDLTNPG